MHHRYCEVGGRPTEHVGQDDDAGARVDGLDGVYDVLPPLFHIVIGRYRYRRELFLRPDDMLDCVAKFLGQPSVRHQHESDHIKAPVGTAFHQSPALVGLSAPAEKQERYLVDAASVDKGIFSTLSAILTHAGERHRAQAGHDRIDGLHEPQARQREFGQRNPANQALQRLLITGRLLLKDKVADEIDDGCRGVRHSNWPKSVDFCHAGNGIGRPNDKP